MPQKKNLLPEQIYGDQAKFVNNMGFGFGFGNNDINVQPIYGCPTPPYTTYEQPFPDNKLRKIKDILTVTEFEKLDIVRIIGFNKEELNEYIQLLIKVRDSGAYDEPEKVSEPERPSISGITVDDLEKIFDGAEQAIKNGAVNTRGTLSSISYPDHPYVINDNPVSLTSEGDEK